MGFVLTFLSVIAAMVFFRSPTMTSAIDLVRGIIGLNGIGLPEALFGHLGPLAERLHGAGVIAESWSLPDFAKTALWISLLMFVALACPNTLQILAPYEPALGVTAQSAKLRAGSIVQWNASLPWAVAMSAVAAIAIISVGGPSEFLYWQF
jgi:alginate O-acetyltransferase complex protein AlgI